MAMWKVKCCQEEEKLNFCYINSYRNIVKSLFKPIEKNYQKQPTFDKDSKDIK